MRRSWRSAQQQESNAAAAAASSSSEQLGWQPVAAAAAASSSSSSDSFPPNGTDDDDARRGDRPPPSYRIAIVSDFFLPRLGGVELHQYSLAVALRRRGHKVVVITGSYDEEGGASDARPTNRGGNAAAGQRQGVRWVTEGLKVYHLPVVALSQQASLPTLYGTFHLLRSVLLRERIQLVHGHQSTSSLAHEALLHASTMGLGCVFTDHSLFPFSNAPAINLNKLMKFTLSHTQHVICVSHCSKENLCLRAYLEPERVSVIPNAVDCSKLRPDPGAAPKDIESKFTIVILSRLVYRKGVDLILDVIPIISARFPHVHWLIGGDGPKRALLEQMREKHGLHERVEMLGSVPHERVRSVLCRGHLFLNASLTEAFCIAILEAVSVGLFVVSTRVGGVPEILPEDMLTFAEPNVPALAEAVARAIGHVRTLAKQDAGRGLESYAWRAHRSVQHMYNWHAVAARTEKVYERVLHARAAEARRAAVEDEEDDEDDDEEARERKLQQIASFEASQSQPPQPGDSCVEPYVGVSLSRLSRLRACGPFAGLLFVAAVLLDHWLWLLLRWIWPAEDMDVAPDMPPPNELTPEQIDQFVEQRRTQMEESDDS